MSDLLRVETNERVDLADFEFLADSLGQSEQESMANFATNPSGQRAWILDGFRPYSPVAGQVRVDRGRAILSYRDVGVVKYGAFAVAGDSNKIIDISGYSPGTYGVYIRFEYVDSEFRSRVFWNPTGGGSEFAQTIATRQIANWSMRIESTNPGAEWLQIGTVDQATSTVTDMRPLFFEGRVDGSYASGWSTDGGGSSNDRNADRKTYGVSDLQMFTAAMRQCLKDIKGRGLREWYSRDIGGMNLGFDAAPVEDRLAVGDANFYMDKAGDPLINFDSGGDKVSWNRTNSTFGISVAGTEYFTFGQSSGNPELAFDTGDHLDYNRASNYWSFYVGTVETSRITATTQWWGDANFRTDFNSGDPSIYFNATDFVTNDRSLHLLNFTMDGTAVASLSSAGFGALSFLLDSNYKLYLSTNPYLQFDSNDRLWYDRANNRLNFDIGAGTLMQMLAGGLRIASGLLVGFGSVTTPTDDAVLVGDANFGLSFGSGTPGMVVDTNDGWVYDRTLNQFAVSIGGTPVLALDASYLDLPGTLRFAADVSAKSYIYWASGTSRLTIFSGHTTVPCLDMTAANVGSFPGSLRVGGGSASLAAAGDLVVTHGLNVGFDGAPAADTIRIYDANFQIYSNGTADEFKFDSSDYIEHIRGTGTHALHFFAGGVESLVAEANMVRPASDKASDLGSSALTWGNVWCSDLSVRRSTISRTNNNYPYLEVYADDGATNQKRIRLEQSTVADVELAFWNTAGNAHGTIFTFKRRSSGNVYECEYIECECDAFYSASSAGTTELGTSTQYWETGWAKSWAAKATAVGGAYGYVVYTGVSDLTTNSSGVGTIKFKGTGSRDSVGFLKVLIETVAYYIPLFDDITT